MEFAFGQQNCKNGRKKSKLCMHNFDMTGVDAQMKFNILWEDFWEMVF